MKIAIIGTAGRSSNGLTRDLFTKMVAVGKYAVAHGTELVSGGAAWADHVAVTLFLQDVVPKLTLYLPCAWAGEHFHDTGVRDWRTNPGGLANYYHKRFSEVMGYDTLAQIAAAITKGATVVVGNGFHNRNSQIAQCDAMLAFTWARGAPEDGGTLDTWRKCTAEQKVHVSLADLISSNPV